MKKILWGECIGAYTPGPWRHEGQGDITGVENDPKNGCVGPVDICAVYLRTVPGRHDANAQLIAAAPELLKALSAAQAALMSFYYGNASADFAKDMADNCASVIDKATGSKP